MQNLLFNAREPWAVQGNVEFYGVSLSLENRRGKQVSVVQETHGWWSNETATTSYDETFVSLEEVFLSFAEAVERYSRIRTMRAATGFMHSFSWNPFTGRPMNYRPVELPPESQCDPEGNSVSA